MYIIFSVKFIFSYKCSKSAFHSSLFVFTFLRFISIDGLRVKPNAKYSTHFLVMLQMVLREAETIIITLSGR